MEGRAISELVEAARSAGESVREYTPCGGESLPAVDSRVSAFLDALFQ